MFHNFLATLLLAGMALNARQYKIPAAHLVFHRFLWVGVCCSRWILAARPGICSHFQLFLAEQRSCLFCRNRLWNYNTNGICQFHLARADMQEWSATPDTLPVLLGAAGLLHETIRSCTRRGLPIRAMWLRVIIEIFHIPRFVFQACLMRAK